MEKKELIHNKNEKCALTKKKIDTTKENYAIIIDCSGKEIKSAKFYKQEPLRNLIEGNIEKISEELHKKTLKTAGGLMGNLFEKMGLVKEEYVVK